MPTTVWNARRGWGERFAGATFSHQPAPGLPGVKTSRWWPRPAGALAGHRDASGVRSDGGWAGWSRSSCSASAPRHPQRRDQLAR